MKSAHHSATPRARGLGLALLAALVLTIACDRFFSLEATVTSCATGEPLEGADVVVALERGYGEPTVTAKTDVAGRFRVVLNEPIESWARVTVRRAGFEDFTHSFRGAPTRAVDLCLGRAGSEGGSRLK